MFFAVCLNSSHPYAPLDLSAFSIFPRRISSECREQLKVELLQRNEDARLDPELVKVCQPDIKMYCKEGYGGGKTLKCLRQHRFVIENNGTATV